MEQRERKGQEIGQRSKGGTHRIVWLAAMLAGILCVGLACTGCSSRRTASKIQLMKTRGPWISPTGEGGRSLLSRR